MLHHVKVVSLSVGLLVVLSGLSSVSFAVIHHKTAPASLKTAAAISAQSAQSSVATGAALRAIAGAY